MAHAKMSQDSIIRSAVRGKQMETKAKQRSSKAGKSGPESVNHPNSEDLSLVLWLSIHRTLLIFQFAQMNEIAQMF